MKKRGGVIFFAILLFLAVTAAVVYVSTLSFDTTLEFTVRDAVSKNWVWNATVRLQDRVIRSFYQSDAGPVPAVFTHLQTGAFKLEVSAPSYQALSLPVDLKRGRNVLASPLEMTGLEIPNLDHFIVFEEQKADQVVLEIRPVGKDGKAVLNHPCLNLWIGCMVSVQLKNGLPVREPTEEGSARGEVLFRDRIEWSFDPLPETVFRYSAKVPLAKIRASEAPFWVMDYLIVVPNPEKISKEELDRLMQEAYGHKSFEELKIFLDQQPDRFHYFLNTSWNVKGASL